MAKSWRDYASVARDNSDKSDVSPDAAPNVTNVTNVTGISTEISRGLLELAAMAVPMRCDPERWAVVRADAERLAREGWIGRALALGWKPLDLFGVTLDGEDVANGLVVWLNGRSLRALSDDFAVTVDDAGGRSYFNLPRPSADGVRFLWELGRSTVVPFKGAASKNGR